MLFESTEGAKIKPIMTKEYRIVKRETKNGLGETKARYRIEENGSFGWTPTVLKTHYFTGRNGLAYIIKRRNETFETAGTAEKIINILKGPDIIFYKGTKIERVLCDDLTGGVSYINRDKAVMIELFKFAYPYSESLEGIKKQIDRSINHVSEQVVVKL
jgi:hypothetical protein